MNLKLADPTVAWEPTERWSTTDASELYDVASWGKGYFTVGENGNLLVHPDKDPLRHMDLKKLVDQLVMRGIQAPILIRFGQILKHRLGEIHQAFLNAIAEHNYKNKYVCVFPIKVNQQRQVVEEVYAYGRPFGFGLEAGSKPELLAVLGVAATTRIGVLVPVVAGVSSALWTGERFSGAKLASAAVVLGGLALARMGKPEGEAEG